MIHKDYFMRMIQELVTMVRVGLHLPDKDKGSWLDDLERAVGDAAKVNPQLFFSLDPSSAADMLEMCEIDESLGTYIVHAIFLEAVMLESEGKMAVADLRRRQARAIADQLGCSAPESGASAEELSQFFLEDPEEQLDKLRPSASRADAGVKASSGDGGLVLNGGLTEEEMSRFKF